MNEVIQLSIIELLYVALIISVSVLTIYLATTLARMNDVLRDIKRVSKVAAGVADSVDEVKNKALTTFIEATDALVARLQGKKKNTAEIEEENENDD